ncbi:hypothetical protein NFJ02_15g22100 [Pycnococcus provasolii]
MGAATSRFNLEQLQQTVASYPPESCLLPATTPPLEEYTTITLAKRNALNRRSFDITDANGVAMYTTEVAKGTRMWFDVVTPTGTKVARCATGPLRKVWDIYIFDKPTKDAPVDAKASTKAEAPVYKRAQLKLGVMRIDGDFCVVGPDGTVGPPLFHVEAIKGIKVKCQAYCVPAGFDKKSAAELPPLVAYWDWDHNFLRAKHWVNLKLSKGTDSLAFIICVVIMELLKQENPASGTS